MQERGEGGEGGEGGGAGEDALNVADLVRACAGFLLYLPGNPERGALDVVRALAKAGGEQGEGEGGAGEGKGTPAWMLPLLAALAQDEHADGIAGVDANDVLYGGEADYARELEAMASEAMACEGIGAEGVAAIVTHCKVDTAMLARLRGRLGNAKGADVAYLERKMASLLTQ